MEDSLRSIGENDGRRRVTSQRLLLMLALGVASCSTPANPSTPDQPQEPYLGTWSGIVTSDVIGPGSGTIVLDGGIKAPGGPLLTGHWTFVFNDARFNASGTVSGGWLPDRTVFVLLFSPSVVPCPSEPGGVSERTRGASLTLAANRMQGSYIAGGCPGGTMDLARK
jgi:hypothetical protein